MKDHRRSSRGESCGTSDRGPDGRPPDPLGDGAKILDPDSTSYQDPRRNDALVQ
jgi:hypothetical protein